MNVFLMYFIPLLLTIAVVWSIIKMSDKQRIQISAIALHRQSNTHEIIKHLLPKSLFTKPRMATQSTKYNQKNMVKVVILNDKAYWVANNMFYVADAISGRIDSSTTQPLDIHNMSKKELEIMMDILDSLNDEGGQDDSGSTRNK